jgi:FlaA1/EpsC-like NDP-sugar epimerase
LPEAIDLLLSAATCEILPAELIVMKMPSCTIGELAETVGYLYGNEITTIKEVGARPGEKYHEMLLNEHESQIAYVYNDDYYIVSDEKLNLSKVDFKYYSSNSQSLMTRPQIVDMLEKGGFIK